jgi:mono/diheme cytochrome c family protein
MAASLGRVLVAPFALVAISGCAPATSRPRSAPSVASSATPADPYHPPPRDTVEVATYKGWQQFSLHCARCHGEDGQGTSFAPSLVHALRSDGDTPSREEFLHVLTEGRPDKGMPSAAKIGIDSLYFDGLYEYLKGRSDGRLHGGRPARRET